MCEGQECHLGWHMVVRLWVVRSSNMKPLPSHSVVFASNANAVVMLGHINAYFRFVVIRS